MTKHTYPMQILEYNGVDLRSATAEQAAYELAKPADKVSILIQYNPDRKLPNVITTIFNN